MRSPLKLTALFALLLFAFSLVGGTGVGAQDDMEEEFQPSDLEGIQYAVARSWSVDYEALMAESTPGADMAMPEGLLFSGAVILEFDDDGNADAGYDPVTEEFTSEEMMTENAEVEEWDIDLGNSSTSYTSTEEVDGVESTYVVSIVQEDEYIYIVSLAGSEMDLQESAKNVVETMIDNDGSGEGDFSEDGTSSGGLWDKFPGSDDDVVDGLIATDEIIFPEPEDAE